MGGLGAVCMRIHKTRKDDLIEYIDDFRFLGNLYFRSLPNSSDSISFNDDGPIFNGSVFAHGDNLGTD